MEKKFMKYLLLVVLMCTMTISAFAQGKGGNIYGTWKSSVANGMGSVTMEIKQNSMTIKKKDADGEVKTRFFNSFSYNAAKKKIKAHQYKEVEVENGIEKVENERETKVYYVIWVDDNHIRIADDDHEVEAEYGTLARQ